MRLSSVVFPAPDLPRIITSSPACIVKSTPFTGRIRSPPTTNSRVKPFATTRSATAVSISGEDDDAAVFEVQSHTPGQTKARDIRLRQLDPAGAVHDRQLVIDQLTAAFHPPSLAARAAVADHDHTVDVLLDERVMRDDDRSGARTP